MIDFGLFFGGQNDEKSRKNDLEKHTFFYLDLGNIQSFLYNIALRFYLEGSHNFLNLDLSRNKELKIGIWPGWLLEGE